MEAHPVPKTPTLRTTPEAIRKLQPDPVRGRRKDFDEYERHLVFDNIVNAASIGDRERFEAAGRAVRDILSQRWILTEKTYEQRNPKRAYYLSMEYLIGRSLANNITNLLIEPAVAEAVKHRGIDWKQMLGAGARRRPRQRRPRAARGLLSRLHGDDAAPRHGLRAPLRVRHLQAIAQRRLAIRATRSLARPPRSVGGDAPAMRSRSTLNSARLRSTMGRSSSSPVPLLH